ncbi:heavy-metal-associated domain-containing protein [Synechocystis sp. LKSZ1]|uniref:heavy-metal-associated domain-containing protein n=1 Tax=Synechocystis sp. LKSZ1 TaxID=3144951 RepID=UPI00336BB493
MYQFNVPTIACSACATAITQAIHQQDPQAQVVITVESQHVQVNSFLSAAIIQQAIEAAGHEVA